MSLVKIRWGHQSEGHVQDCGIRAGTLIAFRAWRASTIGTWGARSSHFPLLRSMAMWEYEWHPDRPAYGDVEIHGIYSFNHPVTSRSEYEYDPGYGGDFLYGRCKIWGRIVEHQRGYRSEFAKIVSLDCGPESLLSYYRKVYGLQDRP